MSLMYNVYTLYKYAEITSRTLLDYSLRVNESYSKLSKP